MKKLMILGASILQLPAIIKAKEMGLTVIAVDMDKDAVGFKSADICLEISTIDIDKVVKAAKQYNIDGIITLASDMPVRTVAAVANELDIVGISEETALKTTDKRHMRDCLKENHVPIPEYFEIDNYNDFLIIINRFNKRCIVKPVDNSGSRGVFLLDDLNNNDAASLAYEYSKRYSRNGKILIEDFMDGPEVSVETISIDGEVHIIAITDKLTTGAPNFVEMEHSQPTQLPQKEINRLNEIVKAAVKAVGIKEGPSHTEIIITNDGPKIVEVGARLGGDNISTYLVPLSTGIDIVECCIQIALGIKPDLQSRIKKAAAIRYITSDPGRIINIHCVDEAKKIQGIKNITLTKGLGDIATEINSSIDRIGYVIAQSNNAIDAIKACNKAIEKIRIEVKKL